jgi:hypothetical protein
MAIPTTANGLTSAVAMAFIATGMKMRPVLCFAGFTKVISGWEPTSLVKARQKLHP